MIEARERLKEAQRIVVKIGTSSLVYPNGKTNLRRIQTLARVISDLMNKGKEIVLVSSAVILHLQKCRSSNPLMETMKKQ